jgi:hypothetical protein
MAYSKLASYYLHWISKINLWSCIKGNNKTCIDLNKVHPRVKYTHTHMRSKIHLPFIIYCGVEKDNTLLTFDGVDTKKLHHTFVLETISQLQKNLDLSFLLKKYRYLSVSDIKYLQW